MPSVIGISWRPEAVGVAPCAICRNSGTKVMAPNIAAPATKPMAEVTQNTFIRKRPSGRIGSGAARLDPHEGAEPDGGQRHEQERRRLGPAEGAAAERGEEREGAEAER